ncbi:MAG: peroxiredoxin [Hyphomonadaceae bacterium]
MGFRIGDKAPDFTAETTQGSISFHDRLGDSWGVLFSHPKDFTLVCTTEPGSLSKLETEFTKRNAKLIGLSVDPVSHHSRWLPDIREVTGFLPGYLLIGDHDLSVAKLYDMLPAEAGDAATRRTVATGATVRTVYLIGPDKGIKAMLVYPMTSGCNFDELLRLLDSLQVTAKCKVATSANWKQGEDVIIAGSVSDEDARKQYPGGWASPKRYFRIVPQPKGGARRGPERLAAFAVGVFGRDTSWGQGAQS